MKNKFVNNFIKKNFKFYISLILINAICFSCLVTFNHVQTSIENGLNNYLEEYDYYDGLFQLKDGINDNEKEEIEKIENIKDIKYYYFKNANITNDIYKTIRILATDLSKLNLYIVEEQDDGNVLLSIDYANANNIKIGDYIYLNINNNSYEFKVKALVNSPDFKEVSKTIQPSLETSTYGIMLIDNSEFKKIINNYQENLLAYHVYDKDDLTTEEQITNILNTKIEYIETNEDLITLKTIKNDINTLKPIANTLPIIIYIIGLVISILFIKQFINTKTKEIGIMKSLGLDTKYIISIFIYYVLHNSILSSILGLIISIFQTRLYVNLYTNSLNIPEFTIHNNYSIIFISLLITILISLLATILNIKKIVNVNIIDEINNNVNLNTKKINILNNKLIKIKPFIITIFTNPFRFIFSTLNLVLVVIIITGSLTVKYAKNNSINYYYDKEINYNYIAVYKEFFPNNNDNSFYESLIEIDDNYLDLVVVNNLNYVNLYDLNNNKIKLEDGIILSEKDAEKFNKKINDYININGKDIKITNISKQTINFKNYISYNEYNKLFNYNYSNSLYLNELNIEINDDIDYITNPLISKNDINNKYSFIDNYILIIIGVVSIISIIVIFNMSIIYFNERFNCNKTLRTLGYSTFKITLLSLIEIIIQALISLVIGIPLGYYLSKFVTDNISNDYLNLYNSYSNIPILTIIIFVIFTSIIGRIISSKNKIKLLDE